MSEITSTFLRPDSPRARVDFTDLAEARIGGVHALELNSLALQIHARNVDAGWWSTADGAPRARNVGELLCLVHSEISEAMEADRKGLNDDKLPHRKGLEVELADALIRIFDLAAAADLDIGGALVEKLEFNRTRADHKPEARFAPGGKAY